MEQVYPGRVMSHVDTSDEPGRMMKEKYFMFCLNISCSLRIFTMPDDTLDDNEDDDGQRAVQWLLFQ